MKKQSLAFRLIALLLAPLSSLDAAAPSSRPNILFILTDDEGYGDARCFNPQSKIATLHIDKLAAEESNARLPGGIVLGADPIGTQRGISQAAPPVPATHPYRARPGHAQSQSHAV